MKSRLQPAFLGYNLTLLLVTSSLKGDSSGGSVMAISFGLPWLSQGYGYRVKAASSDNGNWFTFCCNVDNSLIALISGAGCPGSVSAGVYMHVLDI